MADNFRIISTNDADAATLSSGDFLAGLPVSNLQLEGRSRVARTTNATGSKVINGTWTEAKLVSALVLYGCNFTSEATLRIECWDAANQTGTKVYDSGTMPALEALGWGDFDWGLEPWGDTVFTGWQTAYAVHWFTATIGALSFRITLADPNNDDGYLQVKRLLLGAYFEPAVNPDYGMQLNWVSNEVQTRTLAGSIRTDAQVKFRELTGSLAGLDDQERARFFDICRVVGLASECFVSVYPELGGVEERDHAMLCKFTGQLPTMQTTNPGRHAAQFKLAEV